MFGRVQQLKKLLIDLPREAKLAYCLMFDPRVPVVNKAALGAATALILSPVSLPAWVPVVGALDELALGAVVVRLFTSAASEEVIEIQRELIAQRTSRFDQDLLRGQRVAASLVQFVQQKARGSSAATGVTS